MISISQARLYSILFQLKALHTSRLHTQKSRIILIRLFLSKPQVWHIITARSEVDIISPFGLYIITPQRVSSVVLFYLFKTEGLGMASIRIANCMELPVGRMASRPGVYPLWCCSFLYSRLFYALITPRVSWKVLPLRTAAFIFSAKAELEYAYLRLISFVSQRNMYLRSAFESSFLAR